MGAPDSGVGALLATYAVGGVAVVAVLGILGGSAAVPSGAPERPEFAPAASAISAPEVAQPLTVLLMGDSYTSGNGARDEAGNAVYYGPERCLRSANTWAEQYARIMEDNGYAVTLLNRACSAATTSAIVDDRSMKDTRVVVYPEPEPVAAPREDQFYVEWAATDPRCSPRVATEEYFVSTVNRVRQADGSANVSVACERWLPAQTAALNRDVDLVLMTVGGNDVRFPDIVRECLILANADTCEGAIDTARDYVRDTFASDLLTVFEDINRKTGGHAKVGYASYPGLEVSDDLRIASVGTSGIRSYPLAQELAALSQEGLEAQRTAVAQANSRFGGGFVTLMDAVPQMFRGHEPDARPGFANPDRWMYEFLETTRRDEWYHLKPEGQERLARYAASFGDFGASSDNGVARDLALIVDAGRDARAVVESALAAPELWTGAQVSIVEQRVADDGVDLERRVIAQAATAANALAALRATSTSPWLPATSAPLQARWNATAQSVFIGDVALNVDGVAPVWSGSEQGGVVTVDARQIDVEQARARARVSRPGEAATVQASRRPSAAKERLAAMLQDLATAPHAWAGGPYVTTGAIRELTATGSFGPGEVNYAWDLDGDGIYETDAAGPRLRVEPGEAESGWVSVRVTTPAGSQAVASAWVTPGPGTVGAPRACSTADAGATARSESSRRGCWPNPASPAGPDSVGVPTDATRALRVGGGAEVGTADGGWAVGDDGGAARDGEPMLAVLTMLPWYVDERVVYASGARVRRVSRAGGVGRTRPRELVRRDQALRMLLASIDACR